MYKLTEADIKEIDETLKLHSDYSGKAYHPSPYLAKMRILSAHYPQGAEGLRISALLDDYFKAVGVKNLKEAFARLWRLEDEAKEKQNG